MKGITCGLLYLGKQPGRWWKNGNATIKPSLKWFPKLARKAGKQQIASLLSSPTQFLTHIAQTQVWGLICPYFLGMKKSEHSNVSLSGSSVKGKREQIISLSGKLPISFCFSRCHSNSGRDALLWRSRCQVGHLFPFWITFASRSLCCFAIWEKVTFKVTSLIVCVVHLPSIALSDITMSDLLACKFTGEGNDTRNG